MRSALPVRAMAFDVGGPALAAGTAALRKALTVGRGALPDVEALASRGFALAARTGPDHAGALAARGAARFPAPFDAEAIRRTLANVLAARPETPKTLHIKRPRSTAGAPTSAATARENRPKDSLEFFWNSSDDEQPDAPGDQVKTSGWLTSDDE